jgi:hypothetical protein
MSIFQIVPIYQILVLILLFLVVIGVNQVLRSTGKMNRNLKQIIELMEGKGR